MNKPVAMLLLPFLLIMALLLLSPVTRAQFDRFVSNLVFDGATQDAFTTTIFATDPTASRTVTLPDADVTLTGGTMINTITATANETTAADGGGGNWTVGIADPLIVGKGGTGAATLTDGGILLGSGTGAITALGVAANGQIPIGDGTTDPVLAALTGTANELDVTNGVGTITLGIVDPLTVTKGGSGTSTAFTEGNIVFAGASGVYTQSDNLFFDMATGELGLGTNVPAAQFNMSSAGTSTQFLIDNTAADGDVFMVFRFPGVKAWTMGVDDGDSDKFKITDTQGLGSQVDLVIDTSGNMTVTGTTDAAGFTEGASNTLSNDISGDAGTVDGIEGASFLRSDAADTATGDIIIDAGDDSLTVGASAAPTGLSGTALSVVNALAVLDTAAANASLFSIGIAASKANLASGRTGSGTFLPIAFFTSATQRGTIEADGGLVWGAPTGGSQGAGTINAVAVYDDSTLLGPDYAFDPGYEYLGLDELRGYIERENHLPTIAPSDHLTGKRTSNGDRIKQLWETVEVQALYILELEERLKRLEERKEIRNAQNGFDDRYAWFLGVGVGILALAQGIQRHTGGRARRGGA